MPDWGERMLGRLLPRLIRRDLFEPACRDLELEQLAALELARGRATRAARRLGHAVRLVILVADCWRVVLGHAFEDRREREPALHASKSPAMLRYHVRHAIRLLVREPGFTAAAALTLALGVGANTAVFAVVDAVLLRPLPYTGSDHLIMLRHRNQATDVTKAFIAIGDYVDLTARQSAFESIAAYGNGQVTVSGMGDPFRVSSLAASPALLRTLGVVLATGRDFEAGDARPGAAPVVILGYELWRTRFASDQNIVGRGVTIGNVERQIVGVAPPGFAFPPATPSDMIVPLATPIEAPADRTESWTFAVARLRPGVTTLQANADLGAISAQLAARYPRSNTGSEYFAVPLRDALVGDTKPALALLLAAVGIVLLVACANVANLLLVRSLTRRREMAVRMALGAGLPQLVVQLLVESLVLTLLAGSVGVLVARWGIGVLIALVPASVVAPGLADARVDSGVLMFALAVSAATALLFGLVSAASVPGEGPAGALTASGRVGLHRSTRRAASTLVVVEVALAVVLLMAAGLVLRSFTRLMAVDPGFQTDHVMTVEMSLPADRYRDAGLRRAFFDRVFGALRRLPGVTEAGAGIVVPLTGNNWTVGFERADRQPGADRPPDVGWQVASGGYFRALGIPLRAGRLFADTDAPATPRVVLISEAIATRYFPGEDPIGRTVRTGSALAQIVGVVGDIRRADLRDEPRADMYFPFEQESANQATLFVRTASDPMQALPAILTTMRSIEPGVVVLSMRSMADVAKASTELTRFALWLFGIFAAIAVMLALVGIYGVMSYLVGQRTREIGMRVALGATRTDIVGMVMRQGGLLTVAGAAMGAALGAAASRLLEALLFGVEPGDPATLTAAAGLLVVAALVACYVPARRAARIDPAKSLSDP